MQKTKIEWADFSWNPIKGMCPEACFYCYARAMYKRFKLDPKLRLDQGELETLGDCWHRDAAMTFDGKSRIKPGQKIFVCSTFELFSPIADQYRGLIFEVIGNHPEQTFIVLTKRPERINRPMPDNVWLGVSVTGPGDWWRVIAAAEVSARVRFISFEPLLEKISWGMNPELEFFDWFVAGRLTGHGKKQDPDPEDVHLIVTVARLFGIPVFLKNNLSGIWPGPLIQERPK